MTKQWPAVKHPVDSEIYYNPDNDTYTIKFRTFNQLEKLGFKLVFTTELLEASLQPVGEGHEYPAVDLSFQGDKNERT